MKYYSILPAVGAFVLGWLLMFLYGYDNEPDKALVSSKNDSVPRFGQRTPQQSQSLSASSFARMDFADYFMSLSNLRTSKQCETIFDNLINNDSLHSSEKSIRMSMLLTKWGELAPRQAIQRVLSGDINKIRDKYETSSPWLSYVFSGWADKAPETAAAFLKDSDDPRIRKDSYAPVFLVRKWAEHSPQQAWEWLSSQDRDSFQNYDVCKQFVIYEINRNSVDDIPEFIANLSEQDAELYSPQLWRSWFREHPDSPEQMASLPEKNRMDAIVGSISGKTKGNLDMLARELTSYNHDEQQTILIELAPGLISGDKAQKEQSLHWLMSNAPEALVHDSVKYSLQGWFHENRAEAKDVLNSLPAGKEKDALMEVYNSPPVEYF